MEKTIKKEIYLEGLTCAMCAAKIEESAGRMTGVKTATVNLTAEKLEIEYTKDADPSKIFNEIKELVARIEPDVAVRDRIINLSQKKILLDGLRCTHCVDLIEREIRNMSGVTSAVIGQNKKSLIVECEKSVKPEIILEHINSLMPSLHDNLVLKVDKNPQRKIMLPEPILILRIIISAIIVAGVQITKPDLPISIALYIAAYIIIGYNVIIDSIKNIIRGDLFDENFLMTIATIGAFAIGEYPEAVSVMIFYNIGEMFQDAAVKRSRDSINSLLSLKVETVSVKRGGAVIELSPENVEVGETIVVRPGEKVGLDGVIVNGESAVDKSSLTGEALPENVKAGDEVLSGVINKSALLEIRVTKIYSESTIKKILDMVQNASSKKAKTEKFITKFAKVYTPAVMLASLLTALLPPLLFHENFTVWLYRALVFLVISCPCALVISIPLGFFGGIGAASRRGILVKGANVLESVNKIKTVAFDKTGTITDGVFSVKEVISFDKYDKDAVLFYAGLGEAYSTHPLAVSILRAMKTPPDVSKITKYEEISGAGAVASTEFGVVSVGNVKLARDKNTILKEYSGSGTAIYVALDGTHIGTVILSDAVKKGALETVTQLKMSGKRLILLTGDRRTEAERVAGELNIECVKSELLPLDKVSHIESEIGSKKGHVMFVGDGINDAPVISRADVGAAMSVGGADISVEAADVVIMGDDVAKIPLLFRIAGMTKRIVFQNIILALGVKAAVLILSFAGYPSMWWAIFADVGVALLTILNSARVVWSAK